MTDQTPPPTAKAPFSPQELWILGLLCAINFCHILDFMLLMPLGPLLMRNLTLDPKMFSYLVSAYSFSAALFGISGALFVDTFDRKKTLLVAFFGLIVGTALCSLANSYTTLMLGRIVAGAFGGVTGAALLAIIGDAFGEAKRGRAMGLVMTSFSVASVAGIPLGLALATWGSWKTPFALLVAIGVAVALMAWKILPPFRAHLRTKPQARSAPLLEVFREKNHFYAFAFTFFTMGAGFFVIPFLSPLLVGVTQLPEKKLPLVYLLGGAATLLTGPLIGYLSDRFGKFSVFNGVSLLSIVPVLITVHLPSHLPPALILLTSTVFMVLISGRFIPSQALIASQLKPQNRGAFMSINGALTSLATGTTAWLGGLLVLEADGKLVGIPYNGFATTLFIFASLTVVRCLKVRT